MGRGRLQEKVVLITGGAQGIGAATARRMAQEGAHLWISDISDRLTELVADLEAVPDEARDDTLEWLLSRQPALVTNDHWKLIDDHERNTGGPTGRPRVKLASVAEMLRIGHA